MTTLKSTSECKDFIATVTNQNRIIKSELSDHGATKSDSTAWALQKSKLKLTSDRDYEWLIEAIDNKDEFVWGATKLSTVVGLTMRLFLHQHLDDGDSAFIILTDDNDELKAWSFQVD